MQKEDNYTFLTQEPIPKVIGTMAVPTIIAMLITNLYNIVDTYFVGKINTQATAAVGIVFSVMFFIQACMGAWLSSGSSLRQPCTHTGLDAKQNRQTMSCFCHLVFFHC